ncbi:MAG: hypothetical protein Tsb009_02350 [Planctomycetaceae bacterium]
MEVSSVSGTNTEFVDPDKVGFASLTADDFLKMFITQLQNQDPTEPVDNEALLNQLATMQNLQANIELGDALEELTKNQQLSSAAAFIGKSVSATADDGTEITGVADRAFLREGKMFLGVGENEIPLSKISGISQ